MAYNFPHGDRDQPFLLPPTCANGFPKATPPGSSWTWSTSSTFSPSTACTATTGTATPPTTPAAARRAAVCVLPGSPLLPPDRTPRPGRHHLGQVIVTAEANDVHQLEPMLHATAATLAAAGTDKRPEAALADSGSWSIANLTSIHDAPELSIPPARHGGQGKPRKDGRPAASRSDGLRAAMKAKLASDEGKARYAKRRETVEPVFGQIKEIRGARRFLLLKSCGGTRSTPAAAWPAPPD